MSVKSALVSAFNSVSKFTDKNAPAILTGFTVGGVIFTAYLASKATVKSLEDLDREKTMYDSFREENSQMVDENDILPEDEWNWKDTIRVTWKNYIPTFLMGCATIACAVGSQTINHKRQVALAAAYEMTRETLNKYKEKVEEQIGKNKARKLESDLYSDEVKKNQPDPSLLIGVTDDTIVFRDRLTGQYFKSNIDKVKAAARSVNAEMRSDMVNLNSFLYDCGAQMSDLAREYYFDYYQTGEIDIDHFIFYSEHEISGHTYVVGTLEYTCKNRYSI